MTMGFGRELAHSVLLDLIARGHKQAIEQRLLRMLRRGGKLLSAGLHVVANLGAAIMTEDIAECLVDVLDDSVRPNEFFVPYLMPLVSEYPCRHRAARTLFGLAQHRDKGRRIAALNALASLGRGTQTEDVLTLLTQLLSAPKQGVREAAAEGLLELGSAAANQVVADATILALRRELRRPTGVLFRRRAYIDVLGALLCVVGSGVRDSRITEEIREIIERGLAGGLVSHHVWRLCGSSADGGLFREVVKATLESTKRPLNRAWSDSSFSTPNGPVATAATVMPDGVVVEACKHFAATELPEWRLLALAILSKSGRSAVQRAGQEMAYLMIKSQNQAERLAASTVIGASLRGPDRTITATATDVLAACLSDPDPLVRDTAWDALVAT